MKTVEAELEAKIEKLRLACQLAIYTFRINDINVPNTIETLEGAINYTPTQCLRDIQAEVVTGCQLIVARATTTYRESPGMGFSSTFEDKTAKQLKQELTKEFAQYAERVRAGEETK